MANNEIRHRARLVKDYAPVGAVLGNEARLGQVFLNLLTNAAHAIPVGAADQNEIRIRIYPAGENIVVEIADTGAGISEQDLPRIFEPFFTTKPIGQGTGLGLAICRNIVLSQGGTIDVQSEVGRGTVFSVRLPAATERAREPTVSTISPLALPARMLKVLVVDDEPLIGRVVRRCMGRQNVVVWLGSGREAVERLESGEKFDVVFLDVMMPDMTGIEVYERIAQSTPDMLPHIAFLTGGAFTPKAREFLEQVPNVQIMKPFEARLLRTVAEDLARAGH